MARRPAALARRRSRGVASVEFAITATLLVTLLLGASEFGRAMFQFDTVVKGARSASRYLSQYQAGDPAAIAAARNIVVCGSISSCATPLVPGLTTAMVTVCDAASCPATHQRQSTGASTVNLVSVTIAGLQFQPMASWIVSSFTFGTIVATMTQGPGE